MQSNTDSKLKLVIDQFTPEVLGVFWITNEELSLELLGFNEFNYLFDGLISQYLYGQKKMGIEVQSANSNIFFTQNFGQKLFLTHVKMNESAKGILENQMTLIQKDHSTEYNKILVFNLTSKDWSSDLKKHYPKFDFINLTLA